jgi:ribosomal protein S18 acetylase RimI-like enzyme
MICRLATKNDLDELKVMIKKVVQKMYENDIKIWNDYYPFEEFAYDIEEESLYLLIENKKIAGTFVMTKSNQISTYFKWKNPNSPALYLTRIAVNVDFLRQGMGGLIIQNAKEIAKSKNIPYLRLSVIDINKPAINLYKKQGFMQVDGVYIEIIPERNCSFVEYGFELCLSDNPDNSNKKI